MKSIPWAHMAAPTRFEIMKTNPRIGIPSNKAAANPNAMKIPECRENDSAMFLSYHDSPTSVPP